MDARGKAGTPALGALASLCPLPLASAVAQREQWRKINITHASELSFPCLLDFWKPADAGQRLMPRDLSSIALVWLRTLKGWSQSDLAAKTGFQQPQISTFERHGLKRERLDELAQAAGYSPSEIDFVLMTLEAVLPPPIVSLAPPSPGVPTEEMLMVARQSAIRVAVDIAGIARSTWLAQLAEHGLALDRALAEVLWTRLAALPPVKRCLLVEHSREFRVWALAERLAEESARAAPKDADTALELSRLGVRVAELASGTEAWRSRLAAYARAFYANSLRVHGSLASAKAEWQAIWELWQAGADGDPARVLPEWRLFDLEASLQRDMRNFSGALDLLARAEALAPAAARGRILINRASVLEQGGDSNSAITVLREAEPLVRAAGDERLEWLLAFNWSLNLCHLLQFDELANRLPELRRRTLEMGNDLDVLRVQWLAGRVAVATGRRAEGRATLMQVRNQFALCGDGFGTAMVSMEIAVLDLQDGRLAQVRRLAMEMSSVFVGEGVDREAVAALRLFCEAARREAATLKQAQAVLRLLGPLSPLRLFVP